ncbi:MAG: PH domain-containing protein [Corynebacterium sp.]|uniref:PH domain-containing protein n=1 Tax=Corynebacterium sp. TaxID=1720 RepID=UPI0026DC9F7E|nr:PH domain-containing protein [Corynebacterium sp.]MDO5097637.1 PH domain-containing protein [Corynebacterium sp.]
MSDNPFDNQRDTEKVLVDVTSPFSALTHPVLELIVITGVLWMIIGYIDAPGSAWADNLMLRNGLVLVWALLALWRFVLPVMRLRSRRLVVTNQRVTIRIAGLGRSVHTFPMHVVRDVARKRSTIYLAISGNDRPVVINDVPHAKRVLLEIQKAIAEQAHRREHGLPAVNPGQGKFGGYVQPTTTLRHHDQFGMPGDGGGYFR